MSRISRRSLLRAAAASAPAACSFQLSLAATRSTDIRIEDVSFAYEDYMYRAPLKFGGAIVDRVTLLNVNCVVRTGAGKVAKGFGSMPMGNIWSFPSRTMSYDMTLNAMKVLAGRISKITGGYRESG